MADSKATDRAVPESAVGLLEASPVPIIVHDPGSGAILDTNGAGEDLFGYEVDELREMAVTDFSPSIEDARQKVEAAFERTAEVGEHELDWEITRPDGTTVEVNVSLRHRAIDGTPLVFAFVTDVSGIRKRERILDGLNDVATALLDAGTAQEVADITTNAAEHVMHAPIASVRLRDGDQLDTAATTSRLPDTDFTPYAIGEGFIGEAFAAGDARVFEELSPAETGPSTTDVRSAMCVPLDDFGVFTVGADAPGQFDESDLELATLLTRLTTAALDQIEREQRLTERTDKLEALLNNAPVIFYELQPDGTITESRGSGLSALGLESGELVGADVREVFAGHDELLEALDRAFDGEQFSTTIEIDGKWLDNSFRPVTGEDGTVQRLVGISFDVTDVKALESKFAALSESGISLSEQATGSDAVAEAVHVAEADSTSPSSSIGR